MLPSPVEHLTPTLVTVKVPVIVAQIIAIQATHVNHHAQPLNKLDSTHMGASAQPAMSALPTTAVVMCVHPPVLRH